MSDLSGRLSGSQAISGSLSGGSVLRGGLSMGGGVSPELLLDKADVITDTASGSIVSIPDGMASPVLGLDVDIEPIQAGTGDPSPDNVRPISGRSEVNVYVEESYDPQATPKVTIQLGQTVYGGKVDVTSGKMTIEYVKKTISSFSGAFGSVTNGYAVYSTQSGTDHSNVNSEYMVSNMFTYYNAKRSSAPLYSYGCNDGANTTQTFILPSTITSKDEANAWLANLETPLECTFKLATPVEVTLTPVQMSTLFGENNVWSDSGDASVEYRADTKKYIQKLIAQALNA